MYPLGSHGKLGWSSSDSDCYREKEGWLDPTIVTGTQIKNRSK